MNEKIINLSLSNLKLLENLPAIVELRQGLNPIKLRLIVTLSSKVIPNKELQEIFDNLK